MQLYRPRHKTAHRALQWLFLMFALFYRCKYQTDTSGYNTTCATLERITAPQHLQCIPDTRRNAGRYTGQHSRPIIIRYIRAQRRTPVMDSCRPCKPGGVSSHRLRIRWQVLRPAHLLRGQRLHLYRVSPVGSRIPPTPGGL